MGRTRVAICLGVAAAALTIGTPGYAQERPARDYDLAAPDLKSALREVARESGLELLAISDDLQGKPAPALKGHYTPQEALAVLLRGTGLTAEISGGTIYIRGRPTSPRSTADNSTSEGSDIVVTGSRIRGAPPTSPITSLTADNIRLAGQADIGDAVRTLPQSFGGGQNPGVAPGSPGSNSNQNSASSINLRGLGSDATLTLLNGHRLAYGSFSQAVDVNAIPLAALDRIEIVADGASALYGSDAVGGVANVLLKRDYEGFATTARFGAATSGGDEQQQYSAVGGAKWSGGGLIATYDFERDTAINARQRDYTAYMPDNSTLLPSLKRHSGLVSLHQDILPGLSFTIDGLYNWRRSATVLQVPGSTRYETQPTDKSFEIAPSLRFDVTPKLSLSLTGVYGRDRTETLQINTPADGSASRITSCYCNAIKTLEAGAEGSLFRLSGGEVRFAIGGGYRYNGFDNPSSSSAIVTSAHHESYYGFGELSIPLVAPSQEVPGIYRLSVNAAMRYENYPGIADVATPKIGILFAPTPDVYIKGSWGKSFKAPTLFQQYQPQYAYLYAATILGGTGYPPNATALLTFGGNRSLKPERATTWTGTIAFHPRALPGARIEISYFHIDYRDRVTQPIQGTNFYSALSGTQFQDFVSAYPSATLQDAIIAQSSAGFINLAGTPYVPANVVALVNDTYLLSLIHI